jgi:hypothetical protein
MISVNEAMELTLTRQGLLRTTATIANHEIVNNEDTVLLKAAREIELPKLLEVTRRAITSVAGTGPISVSIVLYGKDAGVPGVIVSSPERIAALRLLQVTLKKQGFVALYSQPDPDTYRCTVYWTLSNPNTGVR